MSNADTVSCPYCGSRHKPRFLCDTASALLQAMLAKAKKKGLPVGGLDQAYDTGGDALIRTLALDGATVPAKDNVYPGLIISGVDVAGVQLPRWTYANTADQLRKLPAVIALRVEAAIAATTGR